MCPLPSSGFSRSGGLSLPRAAASRSMKRTAALDGGVGKLGQRARRPHHRPDAADVGQRDQQRRFGFHPAQMAHCRGFVLGAAGSLARPRKQRRKVLVRIAVQQRQQPLRIGGRKIPEIGRAVCQTEQQRFELARSGDQSLERLAAALRAFSFSHSPRRAAAAFRSASRGASRIASTRVGRAGAADREEVAFFFAARAMPCHNRAGGGWLFARLRQLRPAARQDQRGPQPRPLSSSRNSPPCRRATAEARLSPSPEPGSERLCSSRTKRSTACSRSCFRDARAVIRHAEQDVVAFADRLDHDLAPSRRRHAIAWGRAYLMALSTRLASAWRHQFAIAAHRHALGRLDLQRQSLLVGQRLVKLADAARDLGGVEFGHRRAGLAGFRARDHQQRVEGADQPVGFLDRGFERGAIFGFALAGTAAPPRRDCAAASAAS